jgi:hypothetical protein
METALHAFEKAGLGKAPFRCSGMFSIPSASMAESNVSAYNNAMAMIPRGLGAGSCAYCGTSIMHNFIITSSDDRRFVVGCDCVARTGDAGLLKLVRAERLKVVREKRAESRKVSRDNMAAIWAAQRTEKAAAFAVEHAALVKRAEPFMKDGGFVADVIAKALEGRYTDRAIEAVERVVADLERREFNRLNSKHFGEVGKRYPSLKVTVERVSRFDRPCFAAPWRSETVFIVTMRDAEGNALVSKSVSFSPEKGQLLTIAATVKAHDRYQGEAQTIVQRIKVKE